MLIQDGSRGKLGARPLRGRRVTQASPRAAEEASRPSVSTAWRILHTWLGPIVTIGVLLIFIFGIGRRLHG
jgi:uncharacterized iron-regulated membrane protein